MRVLVSILFLECVLYILLDVVAWVRHPTSGVTSLLLGTVSSLRNEQLSWSVSSTFLMEAETVSLCAKTPFDPIQGS
jgi:hypothetical protein